MGDPVQTIALELLDALRREADYGDEAYAELLAVADAGFDGMEPEMERLTRRAYEATERLTDDGTTRTLIERAEELLSSPSPEPRS